MPHQLGQTRSQRRADHLLQTPDTFVRAPLPGMKRATAIVHTSPAGGAGFVQYTAELEGGGQLGPTLGQRFVYVLDGQLEVERRSLGPASFAYLPSGHASVVTATRAARVAVLEKPYQPLAGASAPSFFSGKEEAIVPALLGDDPGLEVRGLVPDDPAFDFRVNTMTYQPGASLAAVEVHVMEHGLLMLSGGGIYRLNTDWYPVQAGDFIWMGPYCPQWFGAIGKTPAKYLIYKDWDRHPGA